MEQNEYHSSLVCVFMRTISIHSSLVCVFTRTISILTTCYRAHWSINKYTVAWDVLTWQTSNTASLNSRQHTQLFSLVLNLLHTQSFISFLILQLWLSWIWKTLSWRDNLLKFSLKQTSHYDSLTWSNDSQAKNSNMQLKINFLQAAHSTVTSHSLYTILTSEIRKSM